MIKVGVIGCGHWGPNHIRVFNQLVDSTVTMCADLDEERLKAIKNSFPRVRTSRDPQELIVDPDVDAVCIASPTNTHFELSQAALRAGKHVFCEKPLTLIPEQSLQLKTLAQEQGKRLMVGHVFVFNRGVTMIREYIEKGELGRVLYAHSERTNLGPFRYDVNALWDLAPHDISIFNYLFDSCPENVSARGSKCLGSNQEDLAFASLEYPGNIMANVHVSWMDPKKVRQITIVGDRKMLVWDDLDNEGPIKLYDKHVEKTSTYYETYGDFQLLSRVGSVMIPNIGFHEPLKAQGKYFIDCVKDQTEPLLSDAQKGFDVVNTLCAIQRSIDRQGAPEYLT